MKQAASMDDFLLVVVFDPEDRGGMLCVTSPDHHRTYGVISQKIELPI
jgi:hypothetical protein